MPHPLLTDPEAAAIVEAMGLGDATASVTGDAREVRARARWQRMPDDDRVRTADGDLAGRPVRDYLPADRATGTVLYLHGGGWVMGDLDTNDALCRALAAACGMRLVSLDYRLAPEHPFPAALDDATRALEALAGSGPLVVAGHSAGGNLAAALAIRSRDGEAPPLAHQALLCPVLDGSMAQPSYAQCVRGLPLTADDMAWYWGHYLPDESARARPLASPLRVADPAGLAPATIVAGGADPLRDEAAAYAKRLAAADVDTEFVLVAGVPHLFLGWPISAARAPIQLVGERLAAAAS